MCMIWVAESSSFYSNYESSLISDGYKDAKVEELTPDEVYLRIHSERPDAIVLDNRLPFGSGESLIEAIRSNSPETKIVIVSSDPSGLSKLKNSVSSVMEKPIKVTQFMTVIGQIYNAS